MKKSDLQKKAADVLYSLQSSIQGMNAKFLFIPNLKVLGKEVRLLLVSWPEVDLQKPCTIISRKVLRSYVQNKNWGLKRGLKLTSSFHLEALTQQRPHFHLEVGEQEASQLPILETSSEGGKCFASRNGRIEVFETKFLEYQSFDHHWFAFEI